MVDELATQGQPSSTWTRQGENKKEGRVMQRTRSRGWEGEQRAIIGTSTAPRGFAPGLGREAALHPPTYHYAAITRQTSRPPQPTTM